MILIKKYIGDQFSWDQLILNNDGNYRQLYSWGEYKKDCGWQVARYVVTVNKNKYHLQLLIRGIWPIYFLYVPGGVSDKKYGIDINIKTILYHVKPFSIKYIRFDSNYKKDTDLKLQKSHFEKSLYKMNSSVSMNHNLQNGFDLFYSASSKWKYNLRKSLKNNIKSEITKTINIKDVNNLTMEMNKIKKLKRSDDPDDFKKLFNKFDYETVICKCYDTSSQLVGFRSALIVNEMAWDYYAATNLEGRKLRAGYLSLYEIMSHCKKRGVKFYNLGAIDEKRNPGVAKFKKDSGGDLYNYIGEWDYSNMYGLSMILNFLIYLFLLIYK